MAAGIDSQYGFLYQKYAFILTALKYAGVENYFTYEGIDDIDFEKNELLYSIGVSQKTYIQVKSGKVSEKCLIKVIANWMILDEFSSDLNLILFIENELSVEYKNMDFVKKIISAFKDNKNKNKNAILKKAYEKFKEKLDLLEFEQEILNLISSIKVQNKSLDDTSSEISNLFIENYCQDIKVSHIAKEMRKERFIDHIVKEIDESISKKQKYVLDYGSFIKLIGRASNEINDEKYVPNIFELKKNFRKKACDIIKNLDCREVKQLKLVKNVEEFIIKGIINKLMYMDFKDIYCNEKSIEISNIEIQAKENYDDVIEEFDEFESTPLKIYKNTIEKGIDNDLLPKESMYVKGCYIYLTSDEIPEDFQISWGNENEN